MKKIFTTIILVICVTLNCFSLYAEEEKSELLNDEYLMVYMKSVLDTDVTIEEKTQLNDIYGNSSYTYYELDSVKGKGYAVLNKETFIIPECSLDNILPYAIDSSVVYGGLFSYIKYEKSHYIDISTNKIISDEALESLKGIESYINNTKLSINDKTNKISELKNTRSTIRTITGAGSSTWLYSSGNIQGDCGINCIAMLEKYYDSYVNTNYLPSTLSSESDIKNSIYNYIVNNTSFPTTSLTNTQLASIIVGHTQSVGVSGYYLYTYSTNYNWTGLCSKINADKPMPLLLHNHPTFGNHYVIACGYSDTAVPSTSRIYINSGWTSTGFVWIYQNYCTYQFPCV